MALSSLSSLSQLLLAPLQGWAKFYQTSNSLKLLRLSQWSLQLLVYHLLPHLGSPPGGQFWFLFSFDILSWVRPTRCIIAEKFHPREFLRITLTFSMFSVFSSPFLCFTRNFIIVTITIIFTNIIVTVWEVKNNSGTSRWDKAPGATSWCWSRKQQLVFVNEGKHLSEHLHCKACCVSLKV